MGADKINFIVNNYLRSKEDNISGLERSNDDLNKKYTDLAD